MSFPRDGIVTLPNFLTEEAVATVVSTLQLDVVRLWGRIIQIEMWHYVCIFGVESLMVIGGFW